MKHIQMKIAVFGFMLLIGSTSIFAESGGGKNKKAAKAENARTQFADVGNNRFAYRVIGRKAEVPLLMLTRFRANMDDWDPAFINGLAKDRMVIVFDNAGVSSSSGQVPTSIKGAADDAAKFVQALGYDRVDICGWSMAGFTVQVMAIDYPELVRNVVIIGSGPGGSPETPGPARPEVFEVATKPVVTNTIWEEQDHQYLFFAPESEMGRKAVAASLQRINEARRETEEPITTAEVMKNQNQAIATFWFEGDGNYFQKLSSMKQPTLIINGDRDAFFNLEGQWLLHREIPNSRVAIYPMAGHGPQHQFPTHVASTINTFIEDVE